MKLDELTLSSSASGARSRAFCEAVTKASRALSAHPLVAIDHHELVVASLLRHDDGNLLTDFRQRDLVARQSQRPPG
jgi:hypothetical protein